MSTNNDRPNNGGTQNSRDLEPDPQTTIKHVVGRASRRADRRLDRLAPASIIDMEDVRELTTLSRATIYRKMAAGTFPSNRKLNASRAGWRLAEVMSWLDSPR